MENRKAITETRQEQRTQASTLLLSCSANQSTLDEQSMIHFLYIGF